MGNFQSDLRCEVDWPFVGREEDMEQAKTLLFNNGSVHISGMKKIGKSRFKEELLKQLHVNEDFKDYKLLSKDFELDDIESGYTMYEWFEDFLDSTGLQREKERFQRKYPEQKIACQSCGLCETEYDRCEKRINLLQEDVKTLIKQLKRCKHKIILFLDNVDMLMDSTVKDTFLTFYDLSLDCQALKTVVASAVKPVTPSKNFASLELKPLDDTAILKLLFITTEKRNNTEYIDGDATVTYAPTYKVFKEVNKPYIDVIVRLCEGLPLAAVMSGMLLTEDDGLLTPAELVEILICIRLKSLSPDNCPPDDRLDIYKMPMKQVRDVESFFNCLNEKMTGDSFTKEQAVDAAGGEDGLETSAMVTLKILKPKGLYRSIFYKESRSDEQRTLSDEQRMKWHRIFRECVADLDAIKDIPSDGKPVKDMVLKFMTENVRMAGLDFNAEILSDPKSLEKAIRCLSSRVKTPTPLQAQESEDQSDTDLRMDLLKEDLLETEKFTSYENDVKITRAGKHTNTSPVVKVQAEIGSDKDLQNLPDNNIGNGQHNKVETRYSPAEGSDSGDSDSLHLEFTNVMHQEQFVYYSDAPPPYTTLPEPQQSGDRYKNQTDESECVNAVNQRKFPSVEEPPPSYSSIDLPAQDHFLEASGHNIDNPVHQNRSGMLGQRSHSTHSIYFPPDSQQVRKGDAYQNIKSRPVDPYLRRAHSDPVFSRVGSSSRNNLVCRTIREMDTSINNSLTGPPAINYIPPNIQNGAQPASNGHPVRFNPNEEHNTELPKQCTSHRMNNLKEDIRATFDEARKSVPHMPVVMSNTVKGHSSIFNSESSAFGPTAISNVNLPSCELYSEHENSDLLSQSAAANIPNDKAANHGAKPYQPIQNSPKISFDKLLSNKTPGPMKAPMAVVNPMRDIQSLSDDSQKHEQRSTTPVSANMHANPLDTNTVVSSKVDRVHIRKQMQANGYRVLKKDDGTV